MERSRRGREQVIRVGNGNQKGIEIVGLKNGDYLCWASSRDHLTDELEINVIGSQDERMRGKRIGRLFKCPNGVDKLRE